MTVAEDKGELNIWHFEYIVEAFFRKGCLDGRITDSFINLLPVFTAGKEFGYFPKEANQTPSGQTISTPWLGSRCSDPPGLLQKLEEMK